MPSASIPVSAGTATMLRRIAIIQLPFALILLIAHGIASRKTLPALGLLPLSLSALLSAHMLFRDNVAALGSSVQALTASNIFFLDIMLAILQLALLIPTWILLTDEWHESLIILGTYGSVFMIVDCVIHTWFVLKELWHMLSSHLCQCPHCQSLRGSKGSSLLPVTNEYTPLQSGDDQPNEYRDVEANIEIGK